MAHRCIDRLKKKVNLLLGSHAIQMFFNMPIQAPTWDHYDRNMYIIYL